MILIGPFWSLQPWYSVLLQRLLVPHIMLPYKTYLLFTHEGQVLYPDPPIHEISSLAPKVLNYSHLQLSPDSMEFIKEVCRPSVHSCYRFKWVEEILHLVLIQEY